MCVGGSPRLGWGLGRTPHTQLGEVLIVRPVPAFFHV